MTFISRESNYIHKNMLLFFNHSQTYNKQKNGLSSLQNDNAKELFGKYHIILVKVDHRDLIHVKLL